MTTFTMSACPLRIDITVKSGRPSRQARNGHWYPAKHEDAYLAIKAVGPTGERFDLRSHRAWADVKRAEFEEYLADTLDEARASCAVCGIDAGTTDKALAEFEALTRKLHEIARNDLDKEA
jgi:hypothetical protein